MTTTPFGDPAGTAISVDTDALHLAATAITPPPAPPPPAATSWLDAVGDDHVVAALDGFLTAYRRTCVDLAADDAAAAQELHNCAVLYAGIEAALVRMLVRLARPLAPQPAGLHEEGPTCPDE
ncbi:hypothetical protein [Pseudonocardia lacus]|uniref:hypothetical protein n=1 Tax=Pseudonocardia lacus TaxID=2835865 RepID=UPI001BDD059C|nr:hypothetical protein [Pseudonocardia lacus]